MTIGENIKTYRKLKQKTQKELATEIGKSVSSVQKYELGIAIPPYAVLDKIAEALKVNFFDLLPSEYSSYMLVGYKAGNFEAQKTLGRMFYSYLRNSGFPFSESLFGISFEEVAKSLNISLSQLREMISKPGDDYEAVVKQALEIALSKDMKAKSDNMYLLDVLHSAFFELNTNGQLEAVRRVIEMTEISKYTVTESVGDDNGND